MTTTTESAAEAQAIADQLVLSRLAACVQIVGPLKSTYWWRDAVETSEEFMCIIKTRSDVTGEVEASIRALHSYENPEIIVTPIEGGSFAYLAWIASETGERA